MDKIIGQSPADTESSFSSHISQKRNEQLSILSNGLHGKRNNIDPELSIS